MRLRTLLLTTSLALVALALPPADAEPVPDDCRPTTVTLPDGVVVLRDDCTVLVGVWMTCAPPSHTTIDRDLPGGHEATLSVCDGGVGDALDRLVVLDTAAPGCPPRDLHAETIFGGLHVEQEHNCRVHVTFGNGAHCGSDTGTLQRDVSGNTVTVYYCQPPAEFIDCPDDVDGPGSLGVVFDTDCTPHPTADVSNECIGGSGDRKVLYDDGYVHVSYTSCPSHLPPITTASAARPQPDCTHLGSPGVGGLNTVRLRDDCTLEVGVMDGAECVGGWGSRVEHDVAGNTVRVLVCDGGLGYRLRELVEAVGPAVASPDAPTCTTADKDYGGVRIVRDADCGHRIDVGFIACVWNGSWKTFGQYPVTVRVYTCDAPWSASMADPFPTCVREPCGPVPTPPAEPCSKLATSGGAGATYQLDGDCNVVVEVKFYDCVWNGKWHSRTVGPVTVRVYECSTPPTESASMADPFPTCIRECSPVPQPDCTDSPLQAVGVTGPVSLSVRDDCTAEVGILDGAICVGGWGSTTERDVAGNTVRVTVCHGGIGDRIDPK